MSRQPGLRRPYRDRAGMADHEDRAAPHASGDRRRKCLNCRRPFPSEGVHHRICRLCKRVRGPDEPDSGDGLDGEASRAQRERGLRALMGLPAGERGLARYLVRTRHGFRACQWIAGEPSAQEACKCGRTPAPGSPYCERHRVRALLRRPASGGDGNQATQAPGGARAAAPRS